MADQQPPSEYNQSSFTGGMSLLGDDSRLQPNQYRYGLNLTNRNDQLEPILESSLDTFVPPGLIQEAVTFGNYIIIFVSGQAYYRYYTSIGWRRILGFTMSATAPRFWVVEIPVSTTNYARIAATSALTSQPQPNGSVILSTIAGASGGNLPGLLVQDNINQPQFIFLDINGNPATRTTQTFVQWNITYTDATNTVVALDASHAPMDNREYVPIGNSMAWVNGILFIASQDGSTIYRSVSGRPLDFVISVANTLATNVGTENIIVDGQAIVLQPFQWVAGGCFSAAYIPGGDATATGYSVGVTGITCLRPLATGGLFVSAGNANFSVQLNTTQNAPTIFGEYTFLRNFLFNATLVDDRCIFDSEGDTRFIAIGGARSFNAIQQLGNEGRNSSFTRTIQSAFVEDGQTIVQLSGETAGILYDDYELYAVNTIFGPVIAKYDTVNSCWSSFDVTQTGGKPIKKLLKIELSIQRLYAITTDNKLYTLYIGPNPAIASFRTAGVCASMLYANYNIKMNNPKTEIKLNNFRLILNNITENYSVSFTPYVNNRLTPRGTIVQNVNYVPPSRPTQNTTNMLPDVDTQLDNRLFTCSGVSQGWKTFGLVSWTNGSITQFSMEMETLTPMSPARSQFK